MSYINFERYKKLIQVYFQICHLYFIKFFNLFEIIRKQKSTFILKLYMVITIDIDYLRL